MRNFSSKIPGVIIAGGRLGDGDHLAESTDQDLKAMIKVGGYPMVHWVLEALWGSKRVIPACIVGLAPDSSIQTAGDVKLVPDQGSMLGNLIAGLETATRHSQGSSQVFVAAADIPLITSAMIDYFLDQCADEQTQVHYGAVPREIMEARFPASNRSYARLKDVEVAGADVMMLDANLPKTHQELAKDLIGARKSVWRQARKIGFITLLLLALRRLTLSQAELRVSRAFGISGRVILVEYAELGMDVDNLDQLEICRREIEAR